MRRNPGDFAFAVEIESENDLRRHLKGRIQLKWNLTEMIEKSTIDEFEFIIMKGDDILLREIIPSDRNRMFGPVNPRVADELRKAPTSDVFSAGPARRKGLSLWPKAKGKDVKEMEALLHKVLSRSDNDFYEVHLPTKEDYIKSIHRECAVCRKRESTRLCGQCLLVYYCGPDHQKDDWK